MLLMPRKHNRFKKLGSIDLRKIDRHDRAISYLRSHALAPHAKAAEALLILAPIARGHYLGNCSALFEVGVVVAWHAGAGSEIEYRYSEALNIFNSIVQ